MKSGALLIRETRTARGLTQATLAQMLHTTQSAVARLERGGANPTVKTLERVMAAMGKTLVLNAVEHVPAVDETMIAANLRLTPAERLDRFSDYYASLRSLVGSVRDG